MIDASYRVACLHEANEELRIRSKMRDSWLKFHLFSQAAIVGLAFGIKTDLTIATPSPAYGALAPILSLMFCLFYGVQDDLVAGISRYLASMPTDEKVQNWHGSSMMREYYSRGWAPKMKLMGLLLAFAIVPGILVTYWLLTFSHRGPSFWVAVALTGGILVATAVVCVGSFLRRRTLGALRLLS